MEKKDQEKRKAELRNLLEIQCKILYGLNREIGANLHELVGLEAGNLA